ncbi:MAG: DUF4331 domain-containing protein [Myxococcota bacterium]|nr:DUF4331 domain-containing protein [Myxococcota bacterium]
MTILRWLLSAGAFALAACHGGRQQAVGESASFSQDGSAESGVPDGAATPGPGQVDRVGHPLVTVLLVPGPLQDNYNAGSTFDPVPRILQDALESRLEQLDLVALADGGADPVDWPVPDGGVHPLLPLFLSDALLVDTSLSCVGEGGIFAATYLDLDREANALGPPHTTCGGRTPAENVVDKTLALLITGDRDAGTRPTQGIVGPTKPATARFPYLAEPN